MLRLIWKNAWRSRRRTVLTVLSVAASLFLLSTMMCYISSNEIGLERSGGSNRVVVRHATSLTFALPLAYKEKLQKVDHVTVVHESSWFGGQIRNREDLFFSNFGSDLETIPKIWDDYRFEPGVLDRMKQEVRGAVIAKRLLARLNREVGWKIGDTVTLYSPIYQIDMEFILLGTCEGPDESIMLFRYDYMEKVRGNPGDVGTFWLRVDEPGNIPGVCDAVDRMFANSEYETKTETEKAFVESFVSMMGNIKDLVINIGLAVVACILLVAANTMAMAARERAAEQAVMRCVGFGKGRLVAMFVAESILIALIGGVVGVGGAVLLYRPGAFDLGGFAPDFYMTRITTGIGFGVAAAVGFVAGLLPAVGMSRLSIVDGLRRVD
jgi:putative ABC transport system permease protein